MSISGVTASTNGHSEAIHAWFPQLRKALTDLAKSLTSGDLSAAKEAYASLEHQRQRVGQAQSGPQAEASNRLSSGFSAIGDALQSDDLASAQKAFTALTEALKRGKQSQASQESPVPRGSREPASTEFIRAQKAFALQMHTKQKTATASDNSGTSSVGTIVDVET